MTPTEITSLQFAAGDDIEFHYDGEWRKAEIMAAEIDDTGLPYLVHFQAGPDQFTWWVAADEVRAQVTVDQLAKIHAVEVGELRAEIESLTHQLASRGVSYERLRAERVAIATGRDHLLGVTREQQALILKLRDELAEAKRPAEPTFAERWDSAVRCGTILPMPSSVDDALVVAEADGGLVNPSRRGDLNVARRKAARFLAAEVRRGRQEQGCTPTV